MLVVNCIPCVSLEAAKRTADQYPAAWYGVRHFPTHSRFFVFVPEL